MKIYCRLGLLAFLLMCFTNCQKKNKGIDVIDANTTKVELTVSKIKEQTGTIQIGLYNSAENWDLDVDIAGEQGGNEFKVEKVEIEGEELKFTFEDLEAGIYALSIYHDENANDLLDKEYILGIGIPKEPYGFSNNFIPGFSPPKFNECSFEVIENKTTQVNIELLKSE